MIKLKNLGIILQPETNNLMFSLWNGKISVWYIVWMIESYLWLLFIQDKDHLGT